MITTFLRRVPYFSHLSDTHVALLAQQATHRIFAPGEIIFSEGDPSAGLWILEAGSVKAFKLAVDGHEYILRLFGMGDTFNDIAALDGGTNPASAAAIDYVRAWVIQTGALHHALYSDQALALSVIQGLAERARHLVFQLEELALRSATGRLSRFLLEQVENPALTSTAVTRTVIASHLATTPETVSRALRRLEEAGAIRFDRHRIIIIDTDLLRKLALD